ncbi:sensor histidine kinase [Pseudonocardiaceae bacterium YIM PH 21723]|nr:sensor histidine kinase [Pseudonocardiaceae bacterium YIM PH 21723]
MVAELERRWADFGVIWSQSLQLRVVVSTLALSSSVVVVLGIVLQTQITDRLLTEKRTAARDLVVAGQRLVEDQIIQLNPVQVGVDAQINRALDSLTSPNSNLPRGAGSFEPVLWDGAAPGGPQPAGGTHVGDVPDDLRAEVERTGKLTQKIKTIARPGGDVTILFFGIPVRTQGRPLQLYLLFPLTPEEQTLNIVQSTLLVGGVVLLLLLAGITNLVIRQVVRPVRQAAEVAVRFADGNLDERMSVVGEDDVARLAESFNEMAASIQQQILQLEEFGQLQRRFTSDVSHELRTPLTTVRMAADVLHASREDLSDWMSRSTELMVDELDRFESLLGDLLEISRLDAGVADLSAEPVDPRGIVRQALDQVRAIAKDTGTPIEVYMPDEEVLVELDSRRVERILRNLLSNAVDHSEGRPVQVRLKTDEHAMSITVRDFGVGLRPGENELVFNRFWRADPSRNRRTGGTGLGLAIAREDANLHGGRLDAWGERGVGSCFRLTLPIIGGTTFTEHPLPVAPKQEQPEQELLHQRVALLRNGVVVEPELPTWQVSEARTEAER